MGLYIFGSGGGGGAAGTDTSNDSIEGKYVLNPHTFHDKNGNAGTGLIYNWDGTILEGASADGNKVRVQPSNSVRHIAAGSYIDREIELAAMPAGDVSLTRDPNNYGRLILTRTAGYITAGTKGYTLNEGQYSLTRDGATVNLSITKGNFSEDISNQLTVPLANSTVNVTANGSKTFYPPSGVPGMASVTVNTSVSGTVPSLEPNRLITVTSNGSQTFGPSKSSYVGMSSVTVTANVTLSTGTGTVLNGSSYLDIRCPAGHTLYMAGFMAESASYNDKSKVMGGYARKGSTTGRGSYITSSGDPAVGNLTASFDGNAVTITPLSGYSFSGMTYKAFVCYA